MLRPMGAAAILVAITLCGCSTAPPSPSPTAAGLPTPGASISTPAPSASPLDPATVYAAIRTQVEAIRGLRPTADVAPVLIDETQLRANLTAAFDRDNPPSAVEATQRTLIALGLLPAGASLRSLVLDLEAGQVAGYYSSHDRELFVVSRAGAIGPTERATYAHEFTHQLQDQHFHLDALGLQATDQGDRSLARLGLIEGDAVSVQTTWMTQQLTPADLVQILADASDPTAAAALAHAPAFLRETTLFPYQDGLSFVLGLTAAGGYPAVDAAFAGPPDSTEQVLHPAKYAAHEKPIAVAIMAGLATRLGAGWHAAAQDTLGELQLRIWLEQGGVATAQAATAAAGWGGDRLELLEGPSGADVVVVETAWDSPADADQFSTAAGAAIAGLGLHGTVVHAAGSSRVSLVVGAAGASLAADLPG
jgi:hypothetical protein